MLAGMGVVGSFQRRRIAVKCNPKHSTVNAAITVDASTLSL
jgi:hypothetical protein